MGSTPFSRRADTPASSSAKLAAWPALSSQETIRRKSSDSSRQHLSPQYPPTLLQMDGGRRHPLKASLPDTHRQGKQESSQDGVFSPRKRSSRKFYSYYMFCCLYVYMFIIFSCYFHFYVLHYCYIRVFLLLFLLLFISIFFLGYYIHLMLVLFMFSTYYSLVSFCS